MRAYIVSVTFMMIVTISCNNAGDVSPTIGGDSSNENTKPDSIGHTTTFKNIWGGKADEALTHLQDTFTLSGNTVLFLRPDQARYNRYLEQPGSQISTVDSDFGIGVERTLDSTSSNKKYQFLKFLICTKRYIRILDCKNGPVVLDRDSVNYGYVLSSPDRNFISSNEVHSNNYIMEIDEYFELDDYR